jgi:predicted nucleic acid-binding protein
VNLVDSSGWLEFFADGPNASFFEPVLAAKDDLIVPTLALFEVFKVALRERGEDAAVQAVAAMRQGRVIDMNEEIALRAARISLARRLPLADSIIAATAARYEAEIWTQDAHFESVPGVHFTRAKKSKT